jgi:DNA-directed RNA polymerase subunit M/transcription elongation factor TFIIS
MDNFAGEMQRLQERYASLTGEELEAVAADANDLTDVARMALQSELLRRGMNIPLPTAPIQTADASAKQDLADNDLADNDLADNDLAIVHRSWDQEDARNVMGILRDAGIPCFLGPDNLDDANAFLSSFDGGVDIKVRGVDEAHALPTLSQALPPQPDGTEYVVRCPHCHSTEIVFQSLDESPESSAAKNFHWSCDACGYQWTDDGVEERN